MLPRREPLVISAPQQEHETGAAVAARTASSGVEEKGEASLRRRRTLEIALLTGGVDKPYCFGLSTALAAKGVRLDFIGSDEVEAPELHADPRMRFLNLRGSQLENVSFVTKARRVLVYYARLISYAASARPKIFHLLWNNKFDAFDRTLLMFYYRMLGKKIVFTAHNVNAGKRDKNDTWLNRTTLRMQYHLCDRIFVHTEKMKQELLAEFAVSERAATVIPFGINNSIPHTKMTHAEARQRLGVKDGEKAILFFGNIGPYKGLQYLAEAFQRLAMKDASYRLIVAGKLGKGFEDYLAEVQRTLRRDLAPERAIQRIEYIADEDAEQYFKAADVLILPYTHVFQSGVIFLGYSFGLPVVATDVGSLREEIAEGETGFLCRPSDAADLERAIAAYFSSELYRNLAKRRQGIVDFAEARHSWSVVGDITTGVYAELVGQQGVRGLEVERKPGQLPYRPPGISIFSATGFTQFTDHLLSRCGS